MPSEEARENVCWGFNRNPTSVRIARLNECREVDVDERFPRSGFGPANSLIADFRLAREVYREMKGR
jgi:hypothetical protein